MTKLIKIRQRFSKEQIHDIEAHICQEIQNCGLSIKRGSNIAIAVGSRGVANINVIVKSVADCIKKAGSNPFIVPAMGSHGGATAEGQRKILEDYGVTEDLIGAPIRSSMEVVELPGDGLKNKVYMDKNAYEADGTIVINRVKPHTDFHGPFESGLMKICVIGLGKHKQALEIHKYGVYGLKELIPRTARQVLKHGNIILGLGIVENAYDQTAVIKAVKPIEFECVEKELLKCSRKYMPSLPVDKLDILIIDQMGKEISGSGMDTNIIGRMKISGEDEPETPDITRITVTDITERSHGNATGIGLADFITRKLFDKLDFHSTYENVLTSSFVDRGKLPIIAETDELAYKYALRTCGPVDIENIRMIRIRDTLHIGEMYVSQRVLQEVEDMEYVEIVGEPRALFQLDGSLVPF